MSLGVAFRAAGSQVSRFDQRPGFPPPALMRPGMPGMMPGMAGMPGMGVGVGMGVGMAMGMRPAGSRGPSFLPLHVEFGDGGVK